MRDMFGGVASADVQLRIPPYEPWPAAERLQREYDAVGFFLSGHPLDEYGDLLKKLRVQTWVDFCRAVKAGNSVGRVAATVLDRQERRTKTGNKMGILTLSDQTGHFEAIMFSEGLQQYRDLLEPGAPWCSCSRPVVEGEEVRARIGTRRAAGRGGRQAPEGHARSSCATSARSRSVQRAAEGARRGRGLPGPHPRRGEREVEVKLPGQVQASPQIAGALRAVPGVVEVQMN